VVTHFQTALKAAADATITEFKKYAYPVANNPSSGGWGHNVRQPSYATSPLLYWRFSKDQAYFDAASNMMSYILGLNPLGISYVTGLGFHQIHNPHDRESAYTNKMKWGPKPGITVFGPGIPGTPTTAPTFPAITSLPKERQFADSMANISMAEFTIYETMSHYALYTVLSNGGKWDPTKDPFASGGGAGSGGSGSGGATGAGGSGGSSGIATSAGGSAGSRGGTTAASGGNTTAAGGSIVSSGGTTTAIGGMTTSAGGSAVSEGGIPAATGGAAMPDTRGVATGGGGAPGSTAGSSGRASGCSCSAVSGESLGPAAWILALLAATRRRRRR
jgi:MYXO-CTERM domain-containing protein